MKYFEEPMDKKSPSIIHSIPWLLGWASLTVMGPLVMAKVIYKTLQAVLYHFVDREKELHGKVVLLTGASSGLGKCLAHALYKRGCRLILASRNVKALEELKQSLIQDHKPPELHIPEVVYLNLEDMNAIPETVTKVLTYHGHVDILINNAGISYRGEVLSTDISVDVKLMVVNYLAQVSLTRAVLKNMLAHRSGHIIGVSSLQGKIGVPYRSCYSASKHAFEGFMDTLRTEVEHHNIHVTVVSPGYIQTNLSLNALTGSGDNYGVIDENIASGMSPTTVADRIVRCLITKEKDVMICSFHHRVFVLLRQLCPNLFFFIMKLYSLKVRSKMTKEKQS